MKQHEKEIEDGIFKIISEKPTPKPWRVRLTICGKKRSQEFEKKDEAMTCRDDWLKEHRTRSIYFTKSEKPIPKPWRVQMMIGGKTRVEKFTTLEEAITCRDAWLVEQEKQNKVVRAIAGQKNDKWHEWRKEQKSKQAGDKKKHD